MKNDEQWLKPYTELEMIFEAMWMYRQYRWKYANDIAHDTYVDRHGEKPTLEEITFAMEAANQADRIVAHVHAQIEAEKEKASSSIIRIN